ncbi:MAG: response regulator [Magnetococcales bacterium]|nr:response regulator [Magnetococcales bacterium]
MSEASPKILIVDDKPANLIALKSLLANVPAEIVTAQSGNETLALCLKNDFALLLLDVQMPQMDGYEVAELLRGDRQTRHIPIIFVTAVYAEEKNKLKGYDAGAVDFILKPIDDRILLSKVRIFLDLHQQKRTLSHQADLLEDKNNQLEQEIRQRRQVEQELRQAKQEAEAANIAKSRFLAAMSHEIRTPLNGVLGFAQLLISSALDEKQRRHVDTIIHSGQGLLTVINDILDFSKVESGAIHLEKIPFDLAPVLENVKTLLTPHATEKGVEMLWQIFPNVPTRLTGDPNRLRQVLLNLLGNAVKFTEKGIVSLYVEQVEVTESEALLRFLVDDSGIGIPDEARSKLFSPFYQADSSTTRRFGGTGLGLAISSGLVGVMGGSMEVDSIVGKGSSFRFTAQFGLPSTQAQSPQPKTGGDVQQPHIDNVRLLVAEDDPMAQSLIGEILERMGFAQVDLVSNGQQVIEKLAKAPYDLLIMDCRMPLMDGYETTREIRRLEKNTDTPPLPILALTANAMEEERQACFAAGMDDFITKPFRMQDLRERIQHLVQTRVQNTPCTKKTGHSRPPP